MTDMTTEMTEDVLLDEYEQYKPQAVEILREWAQAHGLEFDESMARGTWYLGDGKWGAFAQGNQYGELCLRIKLTHRDPVYVGALQRQLRFKVTAQWAHYVAVKATEERVLTLDEVARLEVG